jgi:hypothetical protein
MAIDKNTFDNSDLSSGYLEYTHNLNTEDVIPFLTDDNNKSIGLNDLFWLGDVSESNTANIVTIDLRAFGTISGTWKLLLHYVEAAATSSGRRAFELTEATPSDDYKMVLGKALTPSINITLTNFFALLLTKLGFLKVASNLSDLASNATARTNLGVYSTAQSDALVANKATLFQAGSGAVLGVSNTAVYTPSANYHPSTKKYVDDRETAITSAYTAAIAVKDYLAKGQYNIGDISGQQDKTVSIGTTLSTSNYVVVGAIFMSNNVEPLIWYIKSKSTTNFTLTLKEYGGGLQNAYFDWMIYAL